MSIRRAPPFRVYTIKDKFRSSRVFVNKQFVLPDVDISTTPIKGELGFSFSTGIFYSGTTGTWVPVGSGGGLVLNAIDDNPIPSPQYLVNASMAIRNIKSLGNGIVTSSTGNSVTVGWVTNYTTPTPNPFPVITPMQPNGNVSTIYSSDNSIIITPDGNSNYNITTLASGSNPENADDDNPIPAPQYLVNSASEIRNIKSLGNGIVTATTGNSVTIGWVTNYNPPTANPFPILTPMQPNGNVSTIYSSDNSIIITPDGNNNYNLTTIGSSPVLVNADQTIIGAQEELINGVGKIKRVIAGPGASLELPSPDDNYIFVRGYDFVNSFNVPIGGPYVTDLFVAIVPLNNNNSYKFFVKGSNITDNKVYYYEIIVGVRNDAGIVTITSPTINQNFDGDAASVVPTVSGTNFKLVANSVVGKNTFWTIKGNIL